ncbi:MAG: hypothetical protein V1875_02045 [Candidatus Altiarchaeota archaeon]
MSTHAGDETGSKWSKPLVIAAAAGILLMLAFAALFIGVIMWQLGVFNVGAGSEATVTSIGFAKIKPMLAAASFTSDGKFNGVFTNGAGAEIAVNKSGLTVESPEGVPCRSVSVDNPKVVAGDNLRITASGCPHASDYMYTLKVTIPYRVSFANVQTNHVEMGTIRGPVE